MSYGEGYQPTEYNLYVPEGDYRVRLGMPQDVERGGYRIREIPIDISGFPGYGPKKWAIFDAPENDPEGMGRWNRARTQDADAFGVARGDFRPESWRGKIGMVHIGKDKKGYMQVKYAIVPEKDAAPAPAPRQPAPPPRQPAPRQAVPGDDFTDDIPF